MIKLSRLFVLGLLPLLACSGVVRVGKSSQQLRATNLGFEMGSPGIGIPSAWTIGNANRSHFEWATDPDEKRSGSQALRIRSVVSSSGFGGVTQCVETPGEANALQYSGFLKTKDVGGSPEDTDESGAGLWIRVADKRDIAEEVSFDNMYVRWGPGEDRRVDNRRVYGTSDWTQKTVKLVVPSTGGRTCFGVLMSSDGTLWADDLKLEYNSSE
jgi:hypothetical protein